MNNRFTIAIVGCGAAAVSLLNNLVQVILAQDKLQVELMVFEDSPELGAGLAYKTDMPNLLINRPAQTMSISSENLTDFWDWLKTNPDIYKDQLIFDPYEFDQTHSQAYIARNIFGEYLKYTIKKIEHFANESGININFISKRVTQIHFSNQCSLETEDHQLFFPNYIVLCTGNNHPKDIYNLINTPKYIHIPYPTIILNKIREYESIAIIGNSLTAIDIAISLHTKKPITPITMLSRTKIHPLVRGKIIPYKMKYLTSQAIEELYMRKGPLSLRDLAKLFRKELQYLGYKFKFLLIENCEEFNLIQSLKNEIQAAQQERPWQSVLSATNQIIEKCWHFLDLESKRIFINKFHRIWLNNRSPIPSINATILLKMLESKILNMKFNVNNIYYDANNNCYMATFNNNKPARFDWVINATGPARYIEPSESLLYSLIEKGIARENPFGGLDVDFESASVLDRKGILNPYLRAIGHCTTGVYYYTSSLEMIAKRAKYLANDIVKHMLSGQSLYD